MTVRRPCTHTGPEGPCPELALPGTSRCGDHPRKAWATTTSSRHERGYDNREQAAAKKYLRAHEWCQWGEGCDAPATQVDHVIPLSQGGARLDPANFQALCEPHHRTKTAREGNAARGVGAAARG